MGNSAQDESFLKELRVEDSQPPTGSILLLHGETGTAVQRFFSDGLYHAVTGKTYTWEQLFEAGHEAPLLVLEGVDEDEYDEE